jgi:L-rhamnose-H+ transport protein
MSNAAGGLAILVLASMMNASFTLPMKYTSRWAWENTWMAWTIFALLILPPVITLSTVPRLGEIYASVDPSMLLVVMLFGVGWGVAQVFFGLAVDAIGIALTFSLVLGTSAAVGTIILLARLHPERLQTAAGRGVLGGVALVIGGVLLCATAGRMREKARGGHAGTHKSSGLGIALAILCGVGRLVYRSRARLWKHSSRGSAICWCGRMERFQCNLDAPHAGWAIPNLMYCLWLLRKNHTGSKFANGSLSHWGPAFVMAVLWLSSTLLYGFATAKLGSLGPILGWPLLMSLIAIFASLLGMTTGEWKTAVASRSESSGAGSLCSSSLFLFSPA